MACGGLGYGLGLGLGLLGLGLGLGLGQACAAVACDVLGYGSEVGLGVGGVSKVLSDDPGIELGLTVVCLREVTPGQLCPSAKETNRFTRPIPRIQAHTQGCHDAITIYRTMHFSIHDTLLRTTV